LRGAADERRPERAVSDNWQDQITDFFDGSPTEEETLRLNAWIKSSPQNVRRFVREAIVHSHLHDLLNGEETIRQPADERTALTSGETMVLPALTDEDESDEIEVVLPPPPVVTPPAQPVDIIRWRWFWAASITIPLLAGFVIHRLVARSEPSATVASEALQNESPQVQPEAPHEPAPVAHPPTFATVAATVGAQWSETAGQLKTGQRLPATPMFLQSGCAEIKFDSGATMIVEAPARFEVRAVNSVELTSGRIAAKVPPSAHGFAVETAGGRVVDLGTEFGVAISPDGSDQIDVFKGKVMAAAPQAASPVDSLMLSEGQAAVSAGHQIKLDPDGAQAQAFVRSLIPPAYIDMVDLICGGDGSTHLRNGSIDQRTGDSGQLLSMSTAGVAPSDYHQVPRLQVVDGCFVPNGKDIVDSARHTFDFGATNARTLYTIRAGGTVPWPNPGETFTGVLGGVDYSQPNHALILFHPNIGITFDLDAIRRIHPGLKVADFRAVIGNTCPGPSRGISAHVRVLVDGVSRSELPALTHNDGGVNLRVSLADADRFLTIAITDSRKTVVRNWIILGDPQLE
jgi:hypothetical protein